MARPGASGRCAHLADDGEGHARFAQPARTGLRHRVARTAQSERRLRDDAASAADARHAFGTGVMNFYDDIKVGDRYALGSHLFTAAAIKSFAGRFDPQRFHVDEDEAKRSHFGALCASGWHTAVVWMRLMVEFRAREAAARIARGEKAATIGPSPGFRELKWLKPVYAGDTISYESE